MSIEKTILDFISKTETGREGLAAYNTVYGHRENSMLKPLVLMTIDEVIEQGNFRARHFGSSAAGAYQIMQQTLAGLRATERLDGSARFDAEMQDRLGLVLLRRRKFAAWKTGKISDVAFALELAKEWASFPVLAPVRGAKRQLVRGQSYYAGDGINRALVSAEEIEALFVRARKEAGVAEPAQAPPGLWAALVAWLRGWFS